MVKSIAVIQVYLILLLKYYFPGQENLDYFFCKLNCNSIYTIVKKTVTIIKKNITIKVDLL